MDKILIVTGSASPIGCSFIEWIDKFMLDRYKKILLLYNENIPIPKNNNIYEYINFNFQSFDTLLLDELSNFEIDFFHNGVT